MDVVADVPDTRDQIYQPSLLPLRPRLEPLTENPKWWNANRVRDQRREPSCVGHALAAVVDHMRAAALIAQDETATTKATLAVPYVSAEMLYNLARFHDEWARENYGGSSIRGALKGFFYNGVCPHELVEEVKTRYAPRKRDTQDSWLMTRELGANARNIQLGAYYRIRPRLPDMHAALNEANALIVSAYTHEGWFRLAEDGKTIDFDPKSPKSGKGSPQMHAVAIVGYDEEAFWVQNSWGKTWGQGGLARWCYTDWAANVVDAWVLALAVLPPTGSRVSGGSRLTAYGSRIERSETHFLSRTPTDFSGPSRLDVLGHMLPFRDGKLDVYGRYNTNRETLQATVDLIATRYDDAAASRHGVDCAPLGCCIERHERRYNHVLIYFLGGWPDEDRLATDIAAVAPTFRDLGIYPFFVAWDTPMFVELNRIIRHAIEGVATPSKSETLARRLVRDRRIEGVIALPGNRVLRDLRQSARRMFLVDEPDPDLKRKPADQGQAAYCLQRLFEDLAPCYRDGDIDFHVAAHGFGAQLLVECIAHQDLVNPRAVFKTATLISPLVARHRLGHTRSTNRDDDLPTLFDMLQGRGEKIFRRRMDRLAIEHLRILGIARDTLRKDRFSDDYGYSWPEMSAFVMGLDPNAIEAETTESRSEDEMRRSGRWLPLLGLPEELEAFARAARRERLDVEIDQVNSLEDLVDSSLHHELGFHRLVLDRVAHTILGKLDQKKEFFRGNGRRITIDPHRISPDRAS
ncbi:MAG: C1 family peptidase [Hyphomicrobiaceae bacterium]